MRAGGRRGCQRLMDGEYTDLVSCWVGSKMAVGRGAKILHVYSQQSAGFMSSPCHRWLICSVACLEEGKNIAASPQMMSRRINRGERGESRRTTRKKKKGNKRRKKGGKTTQNINKCAEKSALGGGGHRR